MKEPVAVLRDLVRIESPSGHEERAVEYVRALLAGAGVQPIVHGRNVWATRGAGGPTLLLNSHLDTVPATPAWTKPPFEALVDEGKMYGLGVSDAKSCVVGLLFGFLTAHVKRGTLVFAATCDEETGGQGMEVLRPHLPHLDAAVIGEPTALNPCPGQRGLVRLEIAAKGRAGHASRPHEGDNAIYHAARAALALERLASELGPENAALGRPTLCATLVSGGTRPNVIPPSCAITVDGRTTPECPNDALIEKVRAALAHDAITVNVVRNQLVPVLTAESAAVVQAAVRATGKHPGRFGGVSDLFHVRDCPGIILGPGAPPQSHQADEHIAVNAFEQGIEAYRRLVEEFMQ